MTFKKGEHGWKAGQFDKKCKEQMRDAQEQINDAVDVKEFKPMKWKIKPCFRRAWKKNHPEGPVIDIDECELIGCKIGLYGDYTWETCPHGKSQLVEMEDERDD